MDEQPPPGNPLPEEGPKQPSSISWRLLLVVAAAILLLRIFGGGGGPC